MRPANSPSDVRPAIICSSWSIRASWAVRAAANPAMAISAGRRCSGALAETASSGSSCDHVPLRECFAAPRCMVKSRNVTTSVFRVVSARISASRAVTVVSRSG